MDPRDVDKYIKAKRLVDSTEGASARSLIAKLEAENPGIERAVPLLQRILDNRFDDPPPPFGAPPPAGGLWGTLLGAMTPHIPGALNKVAEVAGQSAGALLTGVEQLPEGKAFSVQNVEAGGITMIVVQVRGGLSERRVEDLLDQVDRLIPVKRR